MSHSVPPKPSAQIHLYELNAASNKHVEFRLHGFEKHGFNKLGNEQYLPDHSELHSHS
jgi:hypothetical protein